jgi:FkbM family methyltransferase
VYEEKLTALVLAALRPGDVFLDVGGNEGFFSVLAGKTVGGLRVYCVEPQSRLQEVITENLVLNQVAGVERVQLAFSDREGTVCLYLSDSQNTGASSLFVRSLPFLNRLFASFFTERVPCRTLDSFVRERGVSRLRLVKIDCEGAEALILRGAASTLTAQGIDILAVEYHPRTVGAAACREADEFLRGCGYRQATLGDHAVYHRPSLEGELKALEGWRGDSLLPMPPAGAEVAD